MQNILYYNYCKYLVNTTRNHEIAALYITLLSLSTLDVVQNNALYIECRAQQGSDSLPIKAAGSKYGSVIVATKYCLCIALSFNIYFSGTRIVHVSFSRS